MIFVTIGSMFPFNRLIEAMDDWALAHPGRPVFAQIGDGTYVPRHMPSVRLITPSAFNNAVARASLIVAHAGMGSVIAAAEAGKPLVMLPRRIEQKEHNTDHQLPTARWLRHWEGVFVADAVSDLSAAIAAAENYRTVPAKRLSTTAPEPLVARVREALLQ